MVDGWAWDGTNGGVGLTVDVCDAVDESSGAENVRVLGEKGDAGRKREAGSEVSPTRDESSWRDKRHCTYEMILCLCFRDLKCGSGNRKNNFLSCNRQPSRDGGQQASERGRWSRHYLKTRGASRQVECDVPDPSRRSL